MELVIFNLVINVCDVMLFGGLFVLCVVLVLVCKGEFGYLLELEFGEYVIVCVEDIGVGIEEVLLVCVFELFFMIKEFGKGLGFGLFMVYGMVV